MQMPDEFSARGRRLRPARRRALTASACASCPDDRRAGRLEALLEAHRARRGPAAARLARGAGRRSHTGEAAAACRAGDPQLFVGRPSGLCASDRDAFERSCTSSAGSASGPRTSRRPVLPVGSRAHDRLQGHADHPSCRRSTPTCATARRDRARAGALALLDQHLPQLGAGAPVPDDRPQRRDQHVQGNVNWMRAREAQLASELFGDDLQKLLPIVTPGGSRLGDVRQRARAAACSPAARCRTRR